MNVDFSPKKVPDIEVFTFNYEDRISSDLTVSSAVVTSTRIRGTDDPTPSNMISGAAQCSGQKVLQLIQAGVAGMYYRLRCTATLSDGQIIVIDANVEVQE